MEKKSWDLIIKVAATLGLTAYGLTTGCLMLWMTSTSEATISMWLVSLGMIAAGVTGLVFVWWPRKTNNEGSSS